MTILHKFISDVLTRGLKQNNQTGSNTFSCTIEKMEDEQGEYYMATCSTNNLEGEKIHSTIPFTKALLKASGEAALDDFEITVTV